MLLKFDKRVDLGKLLEKTDRLKILAWQTSTEFGNNEVKICLKRYRYSSKILQPVKNILQQIGPEGNRKIK